jgi:hypothetical protein
MMIAKGQINSLRKNARVAGVILLIITVFAPFSMIYVPSTLMAPENATATAHNIMASEGLLRAGIASDAVIFLLEIVLVAVLYTLLKPVNKTLSLTAAFARLAMTVIQGMNLFNYFLALLLLSETGYLTVFEPDQLYALVALFLDAHEVVAIIWGLFFGLHLLVLGYLVYRSGYISKFVGALLLLASLSYLINGFGNILFPQFEEIFTTIGFLSIIELAFPLWLLIKGVKALEPASSQES